MRIRLGVLIWRALLVLLVLVLLGLLAINYVVSRMFEPGPQVSITVVNQAGVPVVISDGRSRHEIGTGQERAVTLDASNASDDCAEDVDVWTDDGHVLFREGLCDGDRWVLTAADLVAHAQIPVETHALPEVQTPRDISIVISNDSSHDLEVSHADRVVQVGVGRVITAYFEADSIDPDCVMIVAVTATDPEAEFRGARELETVCDGDAFIVDDDDVVRLPEVGDTEG